MLRHISERTALIITFISPSEHTVTGKLKQSHEGLNSMSASGSPKRYIQTATQGELQINDHKSQCVCLSNFISHPLFTSFSKKKKKKKKISFRFSALLSVDRGRGRTFLITS